MAKHDWFDKDGANIYTYIIIYNYIYKLYIQYNYIYNYICIYTNGGTPNDPKLNAFSILALKPMVLGIPL